MLRITREFNRENWLSRKIKARKMARARAAARERMSIRRQIIEEIKLDMCEGWK